MIREAHIYGFVYCMWCIHYLSPSYYNISNESFYLSCSIQFPRRKTPYQETLIHWIIIPFVKYRKKDIKQSLMKIHIQLNSRSQSIWMCVPSHYKVHQTRFHFSVLHCLPSVIEKFFLKKQLLKWVWSLNF